MQSENNQTVRSVTNRIIQRIEQNNKNGQPDTGILAALRNSVGKPISEAEEVWPVLFESVPTSFLSWNGNPTYQENAIFSTLQIYAMGRQGSSENVNADSSYKGNMGRSLSAGRLIGDSQALDRRFNTMVSAENFEGFTYHMRQMFKLVKSKAKMTVNFGILSEDLYRYQLGEKERICFKWAEGYYGRYTDTETQKQEDEINE